MLWKRGMPLFTMSCELMSRNVLFLCCNMCLLTNITETHTHARARAHTYFSMLARCTLFRWLFFHLTSSSLATAVTRFVFHIASLERTRFSHRPQMHTPREMENALQHEWKAIPQATIQILSGSMRRRCTVYCAADGGYACYWPFILNPMVCHYQERCL